MGLRVAFDAREISRHQPGGLRRYAESLVGCLAEHSSSLDLYGYLDREPPKQVKLPNGFHWQIVGPRQLALREQFTLPKRLRLDGIEVAHFPANTAPLRCPVPYVLTLHDTFCIERPVRDILSKGSLHGKALSLYSKWVPVIAAKRAGCVVTVSKFSAESISKTLRISLNRIRVIPPALHPIFRPVVCADMREWLLRKLGAERIALVIGSAQPRKNLATMLKAYKQVRKETAGIGLVVIWTESVEFGEWAARSGIESLEAVHVWRDPTDEDLVKLYSNSDMLLFVSRLEGFGLPVIEAMACGCPVITSTTSALPETAGSAALLADPEDAAAISDAMLRLAQDDLLRESLRVAGLGRAEEFRGQRVVASLAGLYEESVGCVYSAKAGSTR